jgi:hypothetical protein
MDPAPGHGLGEPARPTWTFRRRATTQAEPAEADEPSDNEPVAVEPTVTPALVELGEELDAVIAELQADLLTRGKTA